MQIPGYEVECEIGRGGMATVYRAVQQSLSRQVALKVLMQELDDDGDFAQRFKKEGRILAQLLHPNIVTIYDIGVSENNQLFLCIEYLSGGTLRDRIKQGLSIDSAIQIAKLITRALGFAHERGVIHRDVKPSNIMFRLDGTPVLTDFGVARFVESNTINTLTGLMIGSPGYMSPEQAMGEGATIQSDLYSLGAVIYEMLTGHPPYEAGNPISVALKHLYDPIPTLPKECAYLQPVLSKLLAKGSSDRYKNTGELLNALDLIESGDTGSQLIANNAISNKPPSSRILKSSLFSALRQIFSGNGVKRKANVSSVSHSRNEKQSLENLSPLVDQYHLDVSFFDTIESIEFRPNPASETKAGSRTMLLRAHASKLLDPVEKSIIRNFLLQQEPNQLVGHIIKFTGGRYVISGYGSFGGTTLAHEICELVRMKWQQLSPGKNLNLLFVRLSYEAVDAESEACFKAYIRQLGQQEVFLSKLKISRQPETPCPYIVTDFMDTLDDILAGRKRITILHKLIKAQIKYQIPVSRLILLIDKLCHPNILTLLENHHLFERKEVTYIIIVEQEQYNRWPEKDRVRLQVQDKYQLWPVPCLWESEYGLVDLIAKSLLTRLQKDNPKTAEYYEAFKKHLAFVGRGQLGATMRELCRSRYWRLSDNSEPHIDFDKLDNRSIRHHAWLDDLLNANWPSILMGNFVDRDKIDRAKLGVYSLLDWIIESGTFTFNEILTQADLTPVAISSNPRLRRIVVERLLDVLVERCYLIRDSKALAQFHISMSAQPINSLFGQEEVSAKPGLHASSSTTLLMESNLRHRTKVFISYSRKDADWLERLQIQFKPLERDKLIERWDDTMIGGGANWREEIKAAVASAKVAVLLVSPDFLASDFINSDELPPLLEAAKEEGAVIIPVVVRPCLFARVPKLAQFQSLNEPERSLIEMSQAEQEKMFVKVVLTVMDALKHSGLPIYN